MGEPVLMAGIHHTKPNNIHKIRCDRCRGSRFRRRGVLWICAGCGYTFIVKNGRIEPIKENPGDEPSSSSGEPEFVFIKKE